LDALDNVHRDIKPRKQSLLLPHIVPRSSSLLLAVTPPRPVQETLIKIMLLGDSDVGKSSLFLQLTKKRFNPIARPTAGIDFASYSMKLEKYATVRCQLVDTSGLERYRSVTQPYWKLAQGAIIVYDITNINSFINVKRWVREFKIKFGMIPGSPMPGSSRSVSPAPTHQPEKPDPVIMIIGNKADLNAEREVRTEEAQAYALANDFLFMETSALDHEKVSLAMNIFISSVYYTVTESGAGKTTTQHPRLFPPQASPDAATANPQAFRRASFDPSFISDTARTMFNSFMEMGSLENTAPVEEVKVEAPSKSIPSFNFEDFDVRGGRDDVAKSENAIGLRAIEPLSRSRSVSNRKSRYI